MRTYEEVKRIKETVETEWLKLPGINGVGIGNLHPSEGSEDLGILVYVTDTFTARDVLPAQVEGVPVELRKGRFLPHS